MVLEMVRCASRRLNLRTEKAAELQIRMEELESLENRARAVAASITEAVSGVLDPEPRCRWLPSGKIYS